MRTFAQRPKATRQTASGRSAIPGRARFGQSREANSILRLRRTIGDRAVQVLPRAKPDGLEADATAPGSFGQDSSRIPVHAKAAGRIQPKLAVNTPGDVYEEEADRIADQVMGMTEPRLQGGCTCGGRCSRCKKGQDGHERLRTKRVQAHDIGETVAPPIVSEVISSPGQPLDRPTRGFMESRLGHDFGRVRVHTGPHADAARAIHASAFTLGHDIVFGSARYAPNGMEGRRLLAHELVHVVQQDRGPAPHPGMLQRQEVAEVEGRAKALESNLSASDRATLRQYIDLLRAGRIHSGDNAEVFAAMASLQSAVRGQAETASQGAGAREFGEGALAHSGASFAVAGGLLVDDVSGVGVADDVAIPPAVIYGLGALVLAGAAYLAYAAFSPSEEEVEQASEETERLVRDLMDKIAQATRRAKPDKSPKPEPKPGPRPGPSRTTDVFPIPDEQERGRCAKPSNETTEFVRWGEAGDKSRTMAAWEQELRGAIPDWTGCWVYEEVTLDDQCWVEGSPCPREVAINRAGRWECNGNVWGFDWVGHRERCVNYYQQNSPLPCRITAYQTMYMETARGPVAYKDNELYIEIHPDKVVSSRDGEDVERPWPPR